MENTAMQIRQKEHIGPAADGITPVRHRGFGTIRSSEVICTKTSSRQGEDE